MKILFLLPFSFIPPNSGNKNLTFNLLKYVTKNAICDLILLLDNATNDAETKKAIILEFPEIRQIWIFKKPKNIEKILSKIKFASQIYHPALGSYYSKQLANWLKIFADKNTYDLIHFDMFHMAIYQKYCDSIPSLLVASDAYSMSMHRAKLGTNIPIQKFGWFIQEWLMRNFEKNQYKNFDAVCTVSTEDTKYLKNICLKDNLKTIGIAIGEEYMADPPRSFTKTEQLQTNILCTGAISVPVAASGISKFLDKCYPIITAKFSDTKLTLLGKNIDKNLKKYISKINSVAHLEYVPNYPEFLRQDWIYIYPQRCGSGLQTKVQQAMAVGLPVVGFEEAFGGLNVENGIHCFQCQNYDDFREAVISLMSDGELREKMGNAAAEHIRSNFSIDKVGKDIYQIYWKLINNHSI